MSVKTSSNVIYGRYLLFIAGLGGLLYGIDVGIIAAALLYLDKTISLTLQQKSSLVAAVLFGGMLSSLVAGVLADWFGRKKMMILSGLMFVSSVGLIVISQGFVPLLVGRLLQGMSGGIIAVVVPLYLAECLSAKHRGQGTAIFQFALTFGIVIAAVTGLFYTRQAEAAIAAAKNAAQVLDAQNHAWRGMFLSVVYPGLIFFIGAFFLSESPRWLVRRGKVTEAQAALLRSVPPEEADTEIAEMKSLAAENKRQTSSGTLGFSSLVNRKYVVPFVLACIVLSLNTATGINSVLGYLVIILKQAGMTASHATQGDVAVKVLNCVMTLVGVALVDRKGRKFLLSLGTGGIVIALTAVGLIFLSFESQRTDVLARVQGAVQNNALTIGVKDFSRNTAGVPDDGSSVPYVLTVLYDQGDGNKIATALSNDPDPVIRVAPSTTTTASGNKPKPLKIVRAQYGRVPSENTGWLVTACLCLFIASYSAGPGVVVWLMLSELMPTRIRALGMGIALLLNQGVSSLNAAVFLPVVGSYGYYAMFFFSAITTVFYFLTAVFLLPETKGKSLEEIEVYFERGKASEA